MNTGTHADRNRLEIEFVDSFGLQNTLDMLAQICHDKSEHLRSNWQDEDAARAWVHAAMVVERAVMHKIVEAVS